METKPTQLKLPFPPSVNHYWRRNGSRYFVSKEGTTYRQQVGWLYKGKPKYEGRVKLSIEVYPPDKRRRDLDNLTKGLLDSLQKAGAYEDDEQIDHLEIVRKEPGGYILVTIDNLSSIC